MSHSTDNDLNAALEADADRLAAMGQDPGPTLDDFPDYDDRPDDEDADDFAFGEDDCGRWVNGRLSDQCRLAGTEDCDWECPVRLPGRL